MMDIVGYQFQDVHKKDLADAVGYTLEHAMFTDVNQMQRLEEILSVLQSDDIDLVSLDERYIKVDTQDVFDQFETGHE